eukprot:gene13404-14781_t
MEIEESIRDMNVKLAKLKWRREIENVKVTYFEGDGEKLSEIEDEIAKLECLREKRLQEGKRFEEVTEMMLRVEETAGFEDARLLKGEFSKWYKVYMKMIKMLEDDIDDLFEELTKKMDGVYKSLPHIRNSGGGECWRQVWWLITVWDFVTPILTWEKILEL